jgi:hypothetical protein
MIFKDNQSYGTFRDFGFTIDSPENTGHTYHSVNIPFFMDKYLQSWGFVYHIDSYDTANFVHQQLAQLLFEMKGVRLGEPLWVEIPKDSTYDTYKKAIK